MPLGRNSSLFLRQRGSSAMEVSEVMQLRKKLLAEAKLAEERKSYTQMAIDIMGIVIAASPEAVLVPKERSLLAVAFKNQIYRLRKAWRTLESSIRSSCGNADPSDEAFLLKFKADITETCSGFIKFIDRFLLPSATAFDSKVFYLTLKAEFSWNSAEAKGDEQGSVDAQVAKEAYAEAREIAKSLELPNPCRLAFKLSLTEYFLEYLHKPILASMVAEEALGNAFSGSDSGSAVSILSCEGALQLAGKLSRWKEKLNDQSNAAEGGNDLPATVPEIHEASAPSLQPSSGRPSADSLMLHLLLDAIDSSSVTETDVAQAAETKAAAVHPTRVEAPLPSAITTYHVISKAAPDADPLESGTEASPKSSGGGLLRLEDIASSSITNTNVTTAVKPEAVIIDCPTMVVNATTAVDAQAAITEAIILHPKRVEASSPPAIATDTIMVSEASPVASDAGTSQPESAVSTRGFEGGFLQLEDLASSSITEVVPVASSNLGFEGGVQLEAKFTSFRFLTPTASPSITGTNVVPSAKAGAVHPITAAQLAAAATAKAPSSSDTDKAIASYSEAVPTASVSNPSSVAALSLRFEGSLQLIAKLTSLKLKLEDQSNASGVGNSPTVNAP